MRSNNSVSEISGSGVGVSPPESGFSSGSSATESPLSLEHPRKIIRNAM
ncbi:hypothetical protein [Leeuwenhoekiella aequorea]|nr:hypothetical protein [Leeuwenhoekiella aequorea]